MDEEMKASVEAPMPDLSGAIEKLLAHPELLASVASVLGKPPPASALSEEQEPSAEESTPPSPAPEAISAMAPLLAGLSKGGVSFSPRKDDPRVCLLRALKPYVSAGRCEAIDTMIRITPLVDLLQRRNDLFQGGHH